MVCPANGSSPRQRWQPSSSSPMSRLFLRQPSLIPLLMMFVGGILVGTFLSTQMDTSVIYQRRHLIDTSFYIPSIPQQQQQQLSQPQKDGWQTIHVFTGESAATDEASSQSQPHFSFAQARQDEVVLRLLKNQTNGYFIDLAANDATVLSNTYSLERYFGWEGLCVSATNIRCTVVRYSITERKKKKRESFMTWFDCCFSQLFILSRRFRRIFFRSNPTRPIGIISRAIGRTAKLWELLWDRNAWNTYSFSIQERIMEGSPAKASTTDHDTNEHLSWSILYLFKRYFRGSKLPE